MQYQALMTNFEKWLLLSIPNVEGVFQWYESDAPLIQPVNESLQGYGFYKLNMLSQNDLGQTFNTYNVDTDNFDVVIQNEQIAEFLIDVYTTNPVTRTDSNPLTAFDIANQVRLFVNTAESIEYLQEVNMGYLSAKPFQNLSEVVSGTTTRRVQFAMTFSLMSQLDTTVNRIITVGIEPTYH